MNLTHRHQEILGRVRDGGVARVRELAAELGVTDETIRRDLNTLAGRGVVERVHGGAVAPAAADEDLPFRQRDSAHADAKRAIARAAAATVEPGQVIALDPSTTACHLARALPDAPLTVVTNSVVVCTLLAAKEHIEVICTGGTLDPEAMAFFGLPMTAALEKLNVGRLFFSCKGVDSGRGLSEVNDRHAAAKLALIRSASACTLLADTSKLGLASTVLYAPLSVAEHVVVEAPVTPEAKASVSRLREAGADVLEAEARSFDRTEAA